MASHWRSPGRIGSRAGQNLRQRRLAIHPLCVECKKLGIIKPTDEIDHIVPLAMGGTDTDDNVQGLCFQHHAEKTATEDVSHQAPANRRIADFSAPVGARLWANRVRGTKVAASRPTAPG